MKYLTVFNVLVGGSILLISALLLFAYRYEEKQRLIIAASRIKLRTKRKE